MSDDKIPYQEMQERLARAETILDSLRRGEVDIVVGSAEPLVVRLKSVVEEKERLVKEWQTTFDSTNSAIWVLDHEQRILRSNKTAERIFRQPSGEFIGKHCWEVVHGTREAIPECPVMRVKQSLRRESVELLLGERWFEVSADPILDDNRQYAGAVHIVSDITERKLTEEALRKSERKLRIYNEISNIFFLASQEDMYSEILKKIREVTESRVGIFGYIDENENWVCPSLTREVWDQCQIPDKDFIFPKEKWVGIWGRAMLEKKTLWSNEPFKVPEGHLSITCAMAVPVLYVGQLIGNIVLANKETPYHEEDVALVETIANHIAPILSSRLQRDREQREKEKTQEQLMQAQKMEAIGVLAGGVAHDFNNMLTIILGYGENLVHQLHPGDPLREEAKAIVEAGKRSAALTRQLLAFSRKQTLQPEVLDLDAVIRNLDKMLSRLIGEDIDLELSLSDEINRVMADPGQIEQVIMNLAVNARDAMPKGGKLLIETANVEFDETYSQNHVSVNPGKYVMLAVTDTGCGMDKETLSRVFDPFFSTKEKGEGSGLGLSTVYGIVKQSGGNILAYSEPGRGTTFKIYLPQTEAIQEPKTGAVEKEATTGGGEHILVVEDEQSLRKLMETMLSRLGYKVSVAVNGGEALLLVEEKGLKPDLILTDVVMPNMSGRELVDRLQRNQPDLKVLYMSGYTDNAIVHHGVLEPGTPFIQKPFTLRDIAEKVQAVLRGGAGSSR
ncbi:MAG: response regulator [Deltaproteobacteria bacterium]|nr:response regulator [Deltaproteobacteria bacterium]MBW2352525.1 response regulator [Deltaproteobacteria bacterium]